MVRILFLLIRQDVFDFSEPTQCVSCSSCWIFEIRCREFDISRLFISVCWMCELCLIWLMAWLWHRPPRQICKIANSQSWSSLQLNQCDVEMQSIQYTYWEWIIEWSRKTGCPIEINKISNYIDLWIVMRKTFCAEKNTQIHYLSMQPVCMPSKCESMQAAVLIRKQTFLLNWLTELLIEKVRALLYTTSHWLNLFLMSVPLQRML